MIPILLNHVLLLCLGVLNRSRIVLKNISAVVLDNTTFIGILIELLRDTLRLFMAYISFLLVCRGGLSFFVVGYIGGLCSQLVVY